MKDNYRIARDLYTIGVTSVFKGIYDNGIEPIDNKASNIICLPNGMVIKSDISIIPIEWMLLNRNCLQVPVLPFQDYTADSPLIPIVKEFNTINIELLENDKTLGRIYIRKQYPGYRFNGILNSNANYENIKEFMEESLGIKHRKAIQFPRDRKFNLSVQQRFDLSDAALDMSVWSYNRDREEQKVKQLV